MERHPPANQRAAPAAQVPDADRLAHELTERYRQVMSTKRMNELSSRGTSRQASPALDFGTPQPPPTPNALPSYSALRNIPILPSPPQDARSVRFRNMLHGLSMQPLQWENPGLLDEALAVVPLDRIYSEAEERSQILRAEAESMGKKPQWAYQDCVVRMLMKWFKHSFFSWVDNPPCPRCFSPTICLGKTPPTAEETAHSANMVEVYQCSNEQCKGHTRFPRYNDAMVLLQTRKGRCGEWNNCFGMLCRALGYRVRWVWNNEDHIWLEIYSQHRKRWIHADVCEDAWDKPRLYAEGWGKKLSYCIAFSTDGAMDVTRRYVRNPRKFGLDRTRCPEGVLCHILNEIRDLRRSNMPKEEKFRLKGEDMREEEELRDYMKIAIANEVCNLRVEDIIGGRSRQATEAEKAVERGRISGSTEWSRARGEAGQHDPRNPPSR
jgi:peptide-N4-(N-acetyl-beta-glucosaminyl)asparagine amidase